MQNRILLVSNIGFAHGWIPSNIVTLREYLLKHGYAVDLAFYSVEFSNFLSRAHPELVEIGHSSGEWDGCFHELYFAGKCFLHEDPGILVSRALNMQSENKDIFEYWLKPYLRPEVANEVLAGLRTPSSCRTSFHKNILEYCRIAEQFLEKKIQQVRSENYGTIGFSCNSAQFHASNWMAQRLKEENPSLYIIFGGPMFMDWNIEQYRRYFPSISYFVAGKGEEELPKILHEIKPLRKSELQMNAKREIENSFKNSSNLPIDAYRSIATIIQNACTPWTFQTWLSRNCSWAKCEFCADSLSPRKVRGTDITVQEIEYLRSVLGATSIAFAEPDVNGSKKKFEDLLLKLNFLKPHVKLWCELNARNTSKNILRLMKKVGFEDFQIGIESFSNRLLQKMNKPSTVLDNIKVLKWSRDVGLVKFCFNLICFFPEEDENDLIETQKLLNLIPHLLTLPTSVYLAEFELLRQSKQYVTYSKMNKVEDYDFFTMALPESFRSQIPFWRRKPSPRLINLLWVTIAESIYSLKSRNCSLTWRQEGDGIAIDDLRGVETRCIILEGNACKILSALNDYIYTARQLSEKLDIKIKEVNKELDRLGNLGLLYSESGSHISLVNDRIATSF